MRHFLLFALVLSSVGVFAQKDSSKITIPEGTEVKLKTIVELKGNELKVGDKINLELAEPIIVDDNIVVRPGAKASATVTMASGSKAFGKKGKLEFSIDYIYLAGGKVIKLKSTVASNAKGRGVTTAAVSVLVTPLGLLWHGQQAKFPPGTVFAAYVDHDTVMN